MGKCFFKKGKITCPREAVKVIAVKSRMRVVARWESCPYHVVNANRDAMTLIASEHKGASISSATIDGPKVRTSSADDHIHPYLRITKELHERAIRARQAMGMASNPFFVEAIEEKVTAIEEIIRGKGVGNADRTG